MAQRIARLTLGQPGPGFFGARAFPGIARRGLTDWNTHDYFEFAFCFQGNGRYKTLKRKWRFKSGSVIITNAGEAHCFEPEDRVEVYYLQFNKIFAREFSAQVPREAGSALFLDDFAEDRLGGCRVIAFSPDEAVDLKRLFESLCRESKLRPEGFESVMRARVVELTVKCFRGGKAPPASALRKSHSELALDRALAHLQKYFREDLSLPALAEASGFSADYFSKLFKKGTGYHLNEYVNELRIREVCRLLRHGDGAVSEIAFGSGFRQVQHFNRVFKKMVGLSPRAYQKNPGRLGEQ